MSHLTFPFDKYIIENIIKTNKTPFHIYNEKGIRNTIKKMKKAFSWVHGGFKNYFAVKGLPNPYILKIMKDEGCGTDCSSMAELVLSEKVGIKGENIMFTANDTPIEEFQKAYEIGAIINFDDITHIEYFEKNMNCLPEIGCIRYNPGPLKKGNEIIGAPVEAKYGFTREQVLKAFKYFRDNGIKRFGIHTMVASNEKNPDYFIETAIILFDLVKDIHKALGIEFEFINLGGGIGIPYKPEEKEVDIEYVSSGIKKAYEEKILASGHSEVKIVMECSRYITGPHGYLITKVLHKKNTYKKYIGLDASMANLMRPALYGAYHHITVLGKEDAPKTQIYDVTGSLCENNDKFAINRELPDIEVGDILAIHNTGAHGHAMGFNYNGKLRSAEILLKDNGETNLIRRAETLEDYFGTLDFTLF